MNVDNLKLWFDEKTESGEVNREILQKVIEELGESI